MTAAGETLANLYRGGPADAIVLAEDGGRVSHERLAELVDDVARHLSGQGIGRGDRVALVIPEEPDLVPLLLGVAALGAAAAPLNPAYTREEFAFYFDDLRPAALIVAAGDCAAAREAAADSMRVIEANGGALDGPTADYEDAEPDDIALLLHTSGTTSRPKQVPLRHRNLTASARSIAAFYRLGADDVSFRAMPLFHVHGLVASTLASLSVGGSVVIPKRVLPRRLWGQLVEHGATWISAGPTLHSMALERRGQDQRAPDTLRFVRSCSSALAPELLARCEEAYGAPMLEAYGMTEASHQMTSNPLPPAAHVATSVGVSAGAQIRTVDEAGRDVAVGEVVIRGPGVMSGYLANDEANAVAFVDGWFRTGDRGRIEDGYLYLEGRIKELIIRGGENISPGEIEDALKAHGSVVDAVAFGIASEKYGEEVGAAVALRETVDEKALQAHCRDRLAAFKVPVAIFVLPEIPRTATGKVQRRRIAERILG
ncbi:MAG TPA: AMP-binding protein [Solirubrobacteraceae bacterium]|jgi:acyl-CoA synthetase (AMP-forming)/AMP-acid ligase II